MAGRLAVVVGGGSVGRRKATGLLAAGANVRLVSLEVRPPDWNEPHLESGDGHLEAGTVKYLDHLVNVVQLG